MNVTEYRKIDRVNLVVTLAALVASYFAFSYEVTLGLGAGMVLMSADFWALRKLLARLFFHEGSFRFGALGLLMVKFVAFLGFILGAMAIFPMSHLAFGLGAAIIVFVACGTALYVSSRWVEG